MSIIAPYFQETMIGVAGALTVSGLAVGAAFVKNMYVRRKYPVAGKYLSTFEDLVDGKTVVQTSVSQLKQHGRRITGTTKLRNGRTWRLDGSIMGIGHISGIYSAEACDDAGVGAFYLRINGSRLEGLWSGYDHINRVTTSGRYVFNRLSPVKLMRPQPAHIPAILAIADHVFGPNYVSESDLQIDSGFQVLVGLYQDKVAGFVLGEIGTVSGKLQNAANLQPDITYAEKMGTLGIIKTLGVSERLQGQGIGNQLFLAMEQHLQRKGCTLIAVPAWKDNIGIHLEGILLGSSYEPFLTCERYWKDACDAGTFSCRCRKHSSECLCDLIWYKKLLT